MAFKEFIFSHFPHRWLNLKKEGSKRLFTGLGVVFDWIEEYVQIPVRNNATRNASEALPALENEYGLVMDPSADIDLRRAKIIMKKRMIDCPITMPVLISIFDAISVKMLIANYYNDSIMIISIESNAYSIPYRDILSLLYENIRAHVAIEAEFPVNFDFMDYVGMHVNVQNEYRFDFLTYDEEINIQSMIYAGHSIWTGGEYNIVWEE